jgi:glycosyltransferase involved in cell wall biosynthesis
MQKNAFVFVVCGKRHVARLNAALKFLKHFSRCEIIVVGRTDLKLDCDQVITAKVPSHLDDHRASIFLKTSLHKILAGQHRQFCYLDSDVIAVNDGVDTIFDHARKPISFALDHSTLREFGRYAVNCHCAKLECEHLHLAIRKKFKVEITDGAWRHWNGGVFVFDENSAGFMELWHKQTLAAFADPYWKPRDQGTLAATVWKMGLQRHPALPGNFNFVVDPFRFNLAPRSRRLAAKAGELPPDESYSLRDNDGQKPRPFFLHFINDGVGKRGWKNWDDAELLLKQNPQTDGAAVSKNIAAHPKNGAQPSVRPLSADNRVVHGLWIGPALSKMERLTIQSFIRHGHEFHLWLYDDLNTPLPKEVVIEDANEIIPQNRIMQKADIDPESGVGKGSYSPFSDLFRYKLLYEKGGYWVDMDVTCLRPFNFDAPYLFRAHRVGVVGNIMKCPPRSRLMKNLYEKIGRELNQDSDWLMTNRTLSKMVKRLGLSRYIRSDIWNEELWWEVIRPLMLGDQPIPSQWFAVHWINEFLRTLKESGGIYRGRRLFDVVPDKDNPAPNSALARLYAEHLTPPSSGSGAKNIAHARLQLEAPMNRPAERQPPALKYSTPGHVNILIASLARGGAERIVLETLSGLQRRNTPAKLFVLYENRASFGFAPAANVQVLRLHALEPLARLQKVADEVLASPEPVLYTHLIKVEQIRLLWERGIKTIPVVHNSRDCWQDPPASYNHPNIPFVAAVSDEVAKQLREDGCSRQIVVVRHELQRWSTVEEQQKNRLEIRDRYGIADGTLVIGMVGEFKTQKAYTRAVRVLAQIRQHVPAKLLILGGWDHDWGNGRQAYTATHRLALELGVVTDLLTPGPMPDAEKYYAAFDVFLNTSAYEGLSVSLLEAIQAGCPIVTADVGGNREVLPERGVLVKDSSDIAAYVNGIALALRTKSRIIAQKSPDFDLVPKLWSWLAKYNRPDLSNPAACRGGTLFVTDNLNIGGAQRSLINLLGHLPGAFKKWLCVLETSYCQGYLDEVERSGASVFSMNDAGDYLERVERLLCMIELLKVRNVCFWNVDARIKLLLAKILPAGTVRLTDVSPGPFLFIEMENSSAFQRRIAFSAADYWKRLDHFVAKYAGGIPKNFPDDDGKAVVIPNGVVLPAASEQKIAALPKEADPNLIVGTACRIMPGKRIDFLIDMMAELNRHLKGVTMIVVGGVDPRHADYWPQLLDRLNSRQVTNIYFTGPRHEVTPFLRRLKVFVMMSETPGCPNASLEAMALGIPVVANAAGGTDEQVLHGINGFLVSGKNPDEMSRHVRYLLVNHEARKRFGEAAKITAEKDFSMNLMMQRYARLFENPNPVAPTVRKPSKTRPTVQKKSKSTPSRHE